MTRPYVGTDAIALAVVLLVVGFFFTYLGTRLRSTLGTNRPGRTAVVLMITIWVLSLVAFFVDAITYGLALEQANLVAVYQSYLAPNPVSPLTDISAAISFVVILYLARSHGLKIALVSAFVGAAVGPMIFELPFDLIVLNRIYPPIPPSPILFRLLFFLPLFLVEISTMSLVTLSPLAKLSRYTLFSLAGMFFIFAVWASLGFSYPSDPIPTVLNDVSKVLSFVVAITLFLGDWIDRRTGNRLSLVPVESK
ncbi:MAG: hypothetical protein LYZ69_02745 [Nitrososphaerales archaeon]|nr:hypothetical protein [Nitrososphaerales archaeon]